MLAVYEIDRDEIQTTRKDRFALLRSMRWLSSHGHRIESVDQARSLVLSATTENNFDAADHAQTVVDLWDLNE